MLKEYIYKRRSVRSYKSDRVSDELNEKIKAFCETIKPLFPNLKTNFDLVDRKTAHSLMTWLPPQLIAVYADEGEDALVNAGFMTQQLELYIESLGLGTCWVGLGRPTKETKTLDGLRFVIYLAYGYPKGELFRTNKSEYNRKSLNEISDIPDERLECVRIAPSACNSQPWYFTHSDEKMHIYRNSNIIIGKTPIVYFNNIDIGIGLAHLYVENESTFNVSIDPLPPKKNGHKYICSFVI